MFLAIAMGTNTYYIWAGFILTKWDYNISLCGQNSSIFRAIISSSSFRYMAKSSYGRTLIPHFGYTTNWKNIVSIVPTTKLGMCELIHKYPNTWAPSTLIILFAELLKFSKTIFFYPEILFLKEIKNLMEYSGMYHLSKWNPQNN